MPFVVNGKPILGDIEQYHKRRYLNSLEICVAGWYYEPELLQQLSELHETYHITFISDSSRFEDAKDKINKYLSNKIDHWKIPLPGSEWPKYDYFIKNIWDGGPVLFMHDDIKIHDKCFYKKLSPMIPDSMIDSDPEIGGVDQAFLFQTKEKGVNNQNMHGRGIFCSPQFVDYMLNFKCVCNHSYDREDIHHNKGCIIPGTGPHKGFWFDHFNKNHVSGKPPVGVCHYNDGIYHFSLFVKRIKGGYYEKEILQKYKRKLNVNVKAFYKEFEHGWRGKFGIK